MSTANKRARDDAPPGTKGPCVVCGDVVKVEQLHERCYKHKSCEPKPRAPETRSVYVLVKTADKEGRTPNWETQCDSEVVGVYVTRALAEKAKKIETRGMDSNDGITYNYGECWNTSFVIHKESIQTEVEDDEDEGDY